ncbi:hypothetical protein L1049_026277 [Liquidambar formosana]|uniref:non-specific serine/threonine protein kinase n=1 Tax=Liquidambar formosana TaxID=63359 RepID=A0AAP0NF72_LIQFO
MTGFDNAITMANGFLQRSLSFLGLPCNFFASHSEKQRLKPSSVVKPCERQPTSDKTVSFFGLTSILVLLQRPRKTLHIPSIGPPCRRQILPCKTSSLSVFSASSPSSPAIKSDELQLLLNIKAALQNSNTNVFDSWRADNSIRNFAGITCNSDGSVREIELSVQKLSGVVPLDSICQLQSLEKLSLGRNFFIGTVSDDLKNCTRLKYLDLGNNFFTGSVPDISSMSQLEYLYLNLSGFSGAFPWKSLQNMTNLVSLSLGDNPFDKTPFPPEILQLNKLNWLYLSNCSIEGSIPAGIGNLTELINLELSSNYLTGGIPPEIGRLKKLWQLELYYNSLTGKFPVGLGNLTSLEMFDASSNFLTGDLSELRSLTSLISLQLFENQLSGEVPAEFGDFKRLVNLSLYTNKLTGSLPPNLGSWADFNFIDASENLLTGPLPPDMCKNGKMYALLLLQNQFSGEIPATYANCSSLKRFRANNRLSGKLPSEISQASSLVSIDLSNNQFSGEIPTTIGELEKLSSLYLQNNLFSGPLPETIGSCESLSDLNIAHNSISGEIPSSLGSLPTLNSFNSLSHNNLHGNFPDSILNCSLLEELHMGSTSLAGTLPNFSPMISLRVLNLSYNLWTGNFPLSIANLTNLEVLDFNKNEGFNLWQLPESFSQLTKLKYMVLTTCMLRGRIPPSIGNMTSLTDLELSWNFLVGEIPAEIGFLKNLQQLELYYNQLDGEIPEELGNLTELIDLDMSVNKLTGKLPESICSLPKLQVLQLYDNSLTGEIPGVLGNSTTLTILSLYHNSLTGEVPQKLGQSSAMTVLELSENNLYGHLPAEVCKGGKLLYFLVLGNKFSGELPVNYAKCETLVRFRVSSNHLEGLIPEGLFGLPHVSIIDLASNGFHGQIAKTIGHAKNLSELFLQSNRISGILPPEISQARNLVKIDLSNNLLSGPIPSEICNLNKLNILLLQGNKFNSSIPKSLSSLNSLNFLDLSNNLLTGRSQKVSLNCYHTLSTFQTICSLRLNSFWVIGISAVIFVIGVVLFLKRWFSTKRAMAENDETLSSSFFSYDVKSFHRISFDQREIVDAMVDKNKVGQGGSGTVYKIELSNGEVVAVKRLRSQKLKDPASEDQLDLNKELKTEVETLGSIRHKNIVKLYCYLSSSDCSLLVYEYMPNGNLGDVLHGGRIHLDWPTRHQIALGIAQGLAYLHHDLLPPIIHRDIKTTNILLDVNYHPKVADFGIAKVLQARGGKDSTTTVIAGTYGYLAPEYAYSSKATTKCDVYSFGVVLMELITGKKPVETEFGENKNIIYWVSTKVDPKEGVMEVLDKRLSGSFRDEMIQVLRIALRCTCRAPTHRPTMNEVVQVLSLSHNKLHGNFPDSILNCSLLEELQMGSTSLAGTLPNFSPMTSLRFLNLSYNLWTGDFPLSIANLTNLEVLDFNENEGFNLWQLPESFSQLAKLKCMVLTTCMLRGRIPPSIGNMTSLTDLELTGNFLVGEIPAEIGLLKNLRQLELYYNQLDGEIPEELGNLTELIDLDMSVNKLTGKLPESICSLPKLQVLQLYNNSLTGEIPGVLGNSTTLTILSLYDNSLTGEVPQNLGQSSAMTVLEISENNLYGHLPAEVCRGGKLLYFLVLENKFSGELPVNYAKCETLVRFRVSSNHLEGLIPEGLFGLPHVSIIDLASNGFHGQIAKTIGHAKNLSELFLQSNRISGVLPPEISQARNLVKIDLSNNLLSGPIPSEICNLNKLNLLQLQGNKFNSSIPKSLSSLNSLNVLDMSNNLLTGKIPESLSELLPNSINFSNNLLSGPIPPSLIEGGLVESFSGNPGLCVSVNLNSSDQSFPTCPGTYNRKRLNSIWVIGISVVIFVIGVVMFLKRWFSTKRAMAEHNETLSSSFFSYDVKSFHRIRFDPHEIVEAMVDKNKVGQGGSGTVYKIELSNGEVVAVKRLRCQKTKDPASEDQLDLNKELKTEVETLGSIRHKNIVKLYCYFSSSDCSLLVYEYMPNGNLGDVLHGGRIHLDWPTRHQIALGIAQGLAYLHHDLLPPIIHRDIKTTNILLDVNYHPKVADFGIAKVLQAKGGKDSTTTVIAGTCGYLAPEYAYSSKATTKCDVYSFGVVLMELITGKKPVETEFGEDKNILYWVSTKVDPKEGAMEVLDKRLSGSFRDEMIQVLRIAIRCTCRAPAHRPTMNEVVQLLIEADPRRLDSFKSSNKIKETLNVTKTKNPHEI